MYTIKFLIVAASPIEAAPQILKKNLLFLQWFPNLTFEIICQGPQLFSVQNLFKITGNLKGKRPSVFQTTASYAHQPFTDTRRYIHIKCVKIGQVT